MEHGWFQCDAFAHKVVVGDSIWSVITCASETEGGTASGVITLYTNDPMLCKNGSFIAEFKIDFSGSRTG